MEYGVLILERQLLRKQYELKVQNIVILYILHLLMKVNFAGHGEEIFMCRYFLKRILRQKTFYIAVLAGSILAVGHIIKDVLPYTDPGLGHSPYTKWIESYSPSVFSGIFFMLMPLLASMAMAHLYRQDANQQYLNFIVVKGRKKEYFTWLYLLNFIIGGLTFILPILLNIYLCFMLLPDRKINFLLDITNNITLYGNDTLFPELYYQHPFCHMMSYVFLGFLTAGVFASLALALSFYIRKVFFIWLVPFVICYVYETILCALIPNGGRRFCPTSFVIQVDAGVQPAGVIAFLILGFVLPVILYIWSVRKHEVY